MPGATIEKGATVKYSIVAENAHICAGATVGNAPSEVETDQWGVAVIASNTVVGKKAVVAAKQMIAENIPDVE